jgi:hypothetical protein
MKFCSEFLRSTVDNFMVQGKKERRRIIIIIIIIIITRYDYNLMIMKFQVSQTGH